MKFVRWYLFIGFAPAAFMFFFIFVQKTLDIHFSVNLNFKKENFEYLIMALVFAPPSYWLWGYCKKDV